MHYLFLKKKKKKALREPKQTNHHAGKTKAQSKLGSHTESYETRRLLSVAVILNRRFDAALIKCSRGGLARDSS